MDHQFTTEHELQEIRNIKQTAELPRLVISTTLVDKIEQAGIPERLADAIRVAIYNSNVNIHAWTYAHGMEKAFDQFGIEGVRTQVLYLITNMRKWRNVPGVHIILNEWLHPKEEIET